MSMRPFMINGTMNPAEQTSSSTALTMISRRLMLFTCSPLAMIASCTVYKYTVYIKISCIYLLEKNKNPVLPDKKTQVMKKTLTGS